MKDCNEKVMIDPFELKSLQRELEALRNENKLLRNQAKKPADLINELMRLAKSLKNGYYLEIEINENDCALQLLHVDDDSLTEMYFSCELGIRCTIENMRKAYQDVGFLKQ